MESGSGYKGKALALLQKVGVQVGDVVEVKMSETSVRGTLVPRYEYNDDAHIVVKLRSGYNIGVGLEKIKSITKISSGEKPSFTAMPPQKSRRDLPRVPILGTGGTIASRVDYRTGAVHPAISSEELHSLIPELSEVASIEPEIVLSVYSENLEPEHWTKIADRVVYHVKRGARGIVITTGTDVMGYTSAALSFALQDVPTPVFVVGSQRSSDRPSSDAYLNLIGAVSCAVDAEFSGVFVTMHNDLNDEMLAIHLGTKVRKNHTSARDAFESIGVEPVAYWSRTGLRLNSKVLRPRSNNLNFNPKTGFESKVGLVKFYPSMPEMIIGSLLNSGVRGLVIEGSGLGHINRKNMDVIRKCIESGVVVCMTSQCIWGRVDLKVYDTGRDLLQAGVVPVEDTLPETSTVKLMWVLANSKSTDEAKEMMRSSLVGEVTDRSVRRA